MKKILVSIFLILSLSFPLSVKADTEVDIDKVEEQSEFLLKFDNQIKLEENIFGSLLVFGNNITTNGEINGIAIIFGNDININNNIEYGALLGNDITLNKNIINDSIIAGNDIVLEKDSNIGRDTIIFGNTVTIYGNIGRNIHIYAADVIIDGATIGGNIKIHATNIKIDNETNIQGELSYVEDALIEISDNSLVTSRQTFASINKKENYFSKFLTKSIEWLRLLVIFTVIYLLIPKVFKKMSALYLKKDNELLKAIGIGLLLMLLVPLLIIFLFISNIGISLAGIILAIYIILISIANIFSGYLIGLLIWKKFIKKKDNIFLIGVIGLSILFIASFIPVLNSLVTFISVIIAFGSFYLLFMQSRN